MNPRFCGKYSLNLSQVLLTTSIAGNTLYLLSQNHMQSRRFEKSTAIFYSLFGATIFNLGSILFWMLSKTYLTDNQAILLLYGFITGSGMLYAVRSFFNTIV